jgi:hypothetical protein
MALDPTEVDATAAAVAELYREAELTLLQMITDQLSKDVANDRVSDQQWAQRKLAAVQALRTAADAVVRKLHSTSAADIRQALMDGYRVGWETAFSNLPDGVLTAEQVAALGAAANELNFGSVEALASAVNFDVGMRAGNILRDTVDAFRRAIAQTTAAVVTGVQTRRQASQAAWSKLAKEGLMSFRDKAGRKWALSSYVEMATRTATIRTGTTAQVDRQTAAGMDLVYVSDHVQECKLCRPFEGKILQVGGGAIGDVLVRHTLTNKWITVHVKNTLAGARLEGFQHPNCRHTLSAYLPGVTELPTGTEDPEGDLARQQQRALERAIRAAKADQAAAIDPEAKRLAGVRVKAAQAVIRQHLENHPELKRLSYREQIGAGSKGTLPTSSKSPTSTDTTPSPRGKSETPTSADAATPTRVEPKPRPAVTPPKPPAPKATEPSSTPKAAPSNEQKPVAQSTPDQGLPVAQATTESKPAKLDKARALVHAKRVLEGFGGVYDFLGKEHKARFLDVVATTFVGVPEKKVAALNSVFIGTREGREDSLGLYVPAERVIYIKPELLLEEKYYATSRDAWNSTGFYSTTGDRKFLQVAMDHEFGHHLDFLQSPVQRSNLYYDITSSNPEWNQIPEDDWQGVQFIALNKDRITKEIGIYAAKNQYETIAELYAQSRGNGVHTTMSMVTRALLEEDNFTQETTS